MAAEVAVRNPSQQIQQKMHPQESQCSINAELFVLYSPIMKSFLKEQHKVTADKHFKPLHY